MDVQATQAKVADEQAHATEHAYPDTMQAMVIEGYGGPEQFQQRQMPTPRPSENQILIRTHAASVNPVDWKMRKGMLRMIVPRTFPSVLGFDVSGTIAARGNAAAAAGWEVGEEVCCFLDDRRGGAYAQYALAGANVVVRKPASLSHEEAAAMPLAATTAWQALVDLGKMRSGSRVLINGASGGVGTFAVQIAHVLGAQVTAVCSNSNAELVRRLGADEVIDYQERDIVNLGQTFDIIFDAVAKRSFNECRRILAPEGRYVTTLPSPQSVFFALGTKFMRQKCFVIVVKPNGGDLRTLMRMVDDGKLAPVIDQVIPWQDVAEAHRISEEGHVRGKIVLTF